MNKTIIVGIISLFVGIVASGSIAAYAVNGNHTGIMKAYAMDMYDSHPNNSDASNSMSNENATAALQGKTGDDFDKAFISEMTAHHEEAIEMANTAITNAKHPEVKDLAKNIIKAQTSEKAQMMQWQKQWGYRTQSTDHSMSGMHM